MREQSFFPPGNIIAPEVFRCPLSFEVYRRSSESHGVLMASSLQHLSPKLRPLQSLSGRDGHQKEREPETVFAKSTGSKVLKAFPPRVEWSEGYQSALPRPYTQRRCNDSLRDTLSICSRLRLSWFVMIRNHAQSCFVSLYLQRAEFPLQDEPCTCCRLRHSESCWVEDTWWSFSACHLVLICDALLPGWIPADIVLQKRHTQRSLKCHLLLDAFAEFREMPSAR